MHQHYSYEYKRQCVEMYRQGLWPETPEHFKNPEDFHKMIRRWKKIEDANGPEALKIKTKKKKWRASERYELVTQVLAGNSIKEVSCNAGIDSGQLCQWVKKYKIKGYDGLENLLCFMSSPCFFYILSTLQSFFCKFRELGYGKLLWRVRFSRF